MPTQAFTQADAFADRPFAGNPAAVCVLSGPRDAEWMRLVAREMNLAETAFLLARSDGYDLRWFTPGVEVDLCGHATLASAHVLWEEERVPPTATLRFHTRSGVLTADRRDGLIWLDFPATPAVASDPPSSTAKIVAAMPLVPRTFSDRRVMLRAEQANASSSNAWSPSRKAGS